MTKPVSVKGAARHARAEEKKAVSAASSAVATDEKSIREAAEQRRVAVDQFVNFAQNIGIGGDNPLTTAGYGFNPVTRQRVQLEWMHRGTWIGGLAVDLPAGDMTREGVEQTGEIDPKDAAKIKKHVEELGCWTALCETIQWGRLYGGAIAVLQIDGQDERTPLRLDTINKGQFKGLMVFDRWMCDPSLDRLVRTPGPSRGLPEFYTIRSDSHGMRGQQVHHSRCVRIIGHKLPYWQAVIEQMWGISIFERLFDRMSFFDVATTGSAQLVYRAWVRTLKMKNFRGLVAQGGKALQGVVAQLHFMRRFANLEGVQVIDSEDEMEILQSPAFSGLAEAMLHFGEQLSGALQIPLVRLFGQSPAGLNATGESDLRNYADNVKKEQRSVLGPDVLKIHKAAAYSCGVRPPEDYGVDFLPLYQLTEKERGEIAERKTNAISQAYNDGAYGQKTYLKELKQMAPSTGVFSNITAADIEAASDDPPPPPGAEALEGDTSSSSSGAQPGQKQAAGERRVTGKPTGDGQWTRTGDSAQVVAAVQLAHDVEIVIESKRGEVRRGPDWEVFMPDDYGYIRGTKAPDGEQVDCYVGGDPKAGNIWVVNQLHLDGRPDEPKVMIGYPSMEAAMRTYISGFTDGRGWDRIGSVDRFDWKTFPRWLDGRRAIH